jgi:hypothetical protein
MTIRFNEELGTITIDGRVISASVLREIVDPEKNLLFRFRERDGIIQAVAYSEEQVIWMEKVDEQDQALDFGVTNIST